MKASIETADRIAKLLLSFGVILAYVMKIIAGPFAIVLLAAAVIITVIELIKVVMMIVTRD